MSTSLQWIETLDLYGPTHAEGLKPDQSVELEKKMYEAALNSVKAGYQLLSQLKVPASRRPDYFAEMLKDDKQMTKIRSRLVTAQQRIEAVEERKKKQAQRKFSKQLRAAKIEKKKEFKTAEKISKLSEKLSDKRKGKDMKVSRGPEKSTDKRKGKDTKFQKGRKDLGRNAGRPKQKFALKAKSIGKSKKQKDVRSGGKKRGKK
jgi:rRNA-processing protein EBP2